MAWLSPALKIAKAIALLKSLDEEYELGNTRPIALTASFLKSIVQALNICIINFFIEKKILNPCQIGFRSGCSIWQAHIDFESHSISLAGKKVCRISNVGHSKSL